MSAPNMDVLVSLAKRRGFIFQSSEIYGGTGSCWDYGPLGVELKQNIKRVWWRDFVQERPDMVGLDASILMHATVWKASGHVDNFTDPMVDCRECKRRFRADQVADMAWLHFCPATKGNKFTIPAGEPCKHCGATRTLCPECGKGELTPPRQFNLMFKTFMGPVEEDAALTYLRPETAQGTFVNFDNVLQSMRLKLPFGIAQIGKAFRNEITPGNFIFRTLEFEQMEMEYFVPPAEATQWFEYWVEQRVAWHLRYGIRRSHLRVRPHEAEELSHYSSATSDIEYLHPIGWTELEGIAHRGDFDLTAHTQASGTKLEWVDGDERYTPHVVEPACGVNRAMLAFLVDAYDEEVVAERERTVLRLHPALAPVKVAVLPLIPRSEDMSSKARALYEELRRAVVAEYDDSGQIGRRYRRQDEIGTPYALTIDEQSLEDDTVTIRDRDSLAQERIPIGGARAVVLEKLAGDWTTPKPD
jgi:glycyl-tRNA synthetase